MRPRRVLAAVAGVAVAAYLAICALLFAAQDRLLYFPVPGRAVDAPLLALARPGARVNVSTRNADAAEAVVYFGGNAEDTSAALDTLARAWPDRALYALHYRGYGGSEGRPRETDLVGDAQALARLVQARHRSLILVGRSLGSGIALQVAADVHPRRLLLVTPYASIAGLGAAQFPWVPVRLLMRDRYDSAAVAPRIDVPTTIIAAADDTVVPPWSTRQLLAAFRPGVAHAVVLDRTGHNDVDVDPRYVHALRAAD